jgi:hypothetical protein
VGYSIEIVRDAVLATPSPTPPLTSPPAGKHVEPWEHEQEVTEEDLNTDHDDTPLRVCAIDDLIKDAELLGLARRMLNMELNFTSAEELALFNEAKKEAAWRAAMREEMKAIEDNDTWELTSLAVGHYAIGLKWVYKVKRNEASDVVRHKACLLAKGYVQRANIDFNEVFALVAHLESVCMMVALAVHEGWEAHHMDVKSTFLNDMIKEEVYIQQTPTFIILDSESKVQHLCKTLYGLWQDPMA